ncbi:MAG TPA: antitoxin [Gryllotalpicola sp.]
MGIFDNIADKAGDLVDKAKDALNTDQGEQISDGALDKAQGLASKLTGGKFDDQLRSGRDTADGALGNE